jgi:serine/threonine-protein kinase
MSALLSPLIIARDTTVRDVTELPPALLAQLGPTVPGDIAVGRAKSRIWPLLLGADAGRLLECFQEERTVAEAVIEFARRYDRDPKEVFEEASPVVLRLYDARILVPAGDPGNEESAIGGLPRGTRVADMELVRALQLYDDCEVYLAARGKGKVVLKLSAIDDGRIRGKLKNEAAILEHLSGRPTPELVLASLEEKRPYLALEWLNSEGSLTLANRLRRAGGVNGHRSLVALAARIAEAYAELHAKNVVHGDVHPGNVLIEVNGDARLIDFGVGRFAAQAPVGFVEPPREGVPYFYEPEYAESRKAGVQPPKASIAGEQYCLAALLHYLITGRHYVEFALEQKEMLRQIAQDPPLVWKERGRMPDDPALEQVLRRALAKKPEERYSSTAELAGALRALLPKEQGSSKQETARKPRENKGALLERCAAMGSTLEVALATPPTASIMFGAAGTAYALFRAASLRDDAEMFSAADVWSSRAARAPVESAYYRSDWDISKEAIAPVSLYHSRPGIECVRALIAHARWDLPALRSAMRDFVRAAEGTDRGVFDLATGSAGTLLGCAQLAESIPDDPLIDRSALLALGKTMAESQWRMLEAMPAIGEESGLLTLGIAHGWAGLLFAQLRWAEALHRRPPNNLDARLAQLLGLAQTTERGLSLPRAVGRSAFGDPLAASWCNGAAGMVSLFLLAHRVYRDPSMLDAAERFGRSALDTTNELGSLCCGTAGVGFAALALFRNTGHRDWRESATQLLARAERGRFPQSKEHSLYKGELGAALLAVELEAHQDSAFPLFDPGSRT